MLGPVQYIRVRVRVRVYLGYIGVSLLPVILHGRRLIRGSIFLNFRDHAPPSRSAVPPLYSGTWSHGQPSS